MIFSRLVHISMAEGVQVPRCYSHRQIDRHLTTITLSACPLRVNNSYTNKYVNNWASEASPTLRCSIEISRDIYIDVHVSVVCQINCVGGIT